jgi:subtilisin-like proprotein convertase family protein
VLQQQKPRLIPNDPYFSNQWHLRNIGQVSGISGNDVNIVSAWDSYTGTGINIAITDSGVQNTHVDLAANARTDIDIDINDNDLDPTPQFDSHGTSCAGMAAAKGNNGLGVVGAAFNAGIVGIRLIEAPTSDQDEANAMNHQVSAANPSDRVSINSNSWGPSDNGQNISTFGPLTEAAFINGVTNGRGGKGVIYVWAGGNGRQNSDNVNYDGYASSRYTISVGASGANGAVSYYSEQGASLLVNAPSSYSGTGTTTTTFMGQGNLGSNYTSSFGGTSSAAPLAAGVIALTLQANPNLSWRDVQHILVETATKNIPNDSGWTTNGAGHDFNEDYGFGRINATAAVALAQTWTPLPAEATPISSGQSVNLAIPDNSNVGVSSTITVSSAPATFRTETVEVTFNATHGDRGNLEVTLTAPSGQQAVLARERFDFGANYSNWRFTSVESWDENPNGVWTLLVKDLTSGTTGTFDSWTLTIHGYDAVTTPPDTDQDLIPDSYETNTGIFVDGTDTGSNPNNPDTDGDGVIDGTEVDLGTDPNNANDTPDVPTSVDWGLAIAVGLIAVAGCRTQRRNS